MPISSIKVVSSCFSDDENNFLGLCRMSPMTLSPEILKALDSIAAGAIADSVESETLEFKEDPAHRSSVEKTRAPFIEKIINESICMANSESARGSIVIGVADRIGGPEAFFGTSLEPDDVEHKVFNRTAPNLRVLARVEHYHGARLLIVHIPEALTLYTRRDGGALRRVGTRCIPVTEEDRVAIRAVRANPDFSRRPSHHNIEDIPLEVISEVRRLLSLRRRQTGADPSLPETTTGLLREIGLLTDEGQLNMAGAILLLPTPATEPSIRYLWRPLPGGDPRVTEYTDPLLLSLQALRRQIAHSADDEITRVQFEDGQEIAIPRFPEQAIDESVSNALIHRDWQRPGPVVIDQSPVLLKVFSPGGLPAGVKPEKLLTTQSIPRNPRLVGAMRMLGLAEESSRGFDRMWTSMIQTGRDAPRVDPTDVSVEIFLSAGTPDVGFIKSLHQLAAHFGNEIIFSVNCLIVVWHLWNAPLITEKTAGEKTQANSLEVRQLMETLVDIDLLKPVRDAAEWVLGDTARGLMGKTGARQLAAVSVQEWLETKLSEGDSIRSADAAEALGVPREEITDHLRHLRSLGRAVIDPTGPSRGSNTRWIMP